MDHVVYTKNEYMVIRCKRGHVIMNTNGTFSENHGHVKKLSTCKMLIGLIEKGIVPDSPYLKETAQRISLNKKYIEKINLKIEKEKNKTHYININKGVMRK